MTDAQMERCRKRMDQFLTDLVEPIGRSERRHWAAVYVRGLLLDGERKSIEPLAARLPDGKEVVVKVLRPDMRQSIPETEKRKSFRTAGYMNGV